MQKQNSSIFKDQTSYSLATPYSDSDKGNSKEENVIDFTQPQNSDIYFSTLEKIQKNAKKVFICMVYYRYVIYIPFFVFDIGTFGRNAARANAFGISPR